MSAFSFASFAALPKRAFFTASLSFTVNSTFILGAALLLVIAEKTSLSFEEEKSAGQLPADRNAYRRNGRQYGLCRAGRDGRGGCRAGCGS